MLRFSTANKDKLQALGYEALPDASVQELVSSYVIQMKLPNQGPYTVMRNGERLGAVTGFGVNAKTEHGPSLDKINRRDQE